MSDEQQQAAIGRTVEEYGACKKKLAALQSEAAKISSAMAQVSQSMNAVSALANPDGTPVLPYLGEQVLRLPAHDHILATANETISELHKKKALAATLRSMGLELKGNSSRPAKVASQKSLRILGLSWISREKPGSLYV